jgi:hypothetical protein
LSVQQFLVAIYMVVVPHPPYSSHLAPCDILVSDCYHSYKGIIFRMSLKFKDSHHPTHDSNNSVLGFSLGGNFLLDIKETSILVCYGCWSWWSITSHISPVLCHLFLLNLCSSFTPLSHVPTSH